MKRYIYSHWVKLSLQPLRLVRDDHKQVVKLRLMENTWKVFKDCIYWINPGLFNKAGKVIYTGEDTYKTICQDFHPHITQKDTHLKTPHRTCLPQWGQIDPASLCLYSETGGTEPSPGLKSLHLSKIVLHLLGFFASQKQTRKPKI